MWQHLVGINNSFLPPANYFTLHFSFYKKALFVVVVVSNSKAWLDAASVALDRPKMGSQNQKSGFAQSLKISIFSVPKLQENVQGSI